MYKVNLNETPLAQIKENKMKRYTIGLITGILLIVLPLLLIVGCSKPINEEILIEKGGLKYHPDTKELYSGKVFKNRMGGKTEFEGSYKDGKREGKWTEWYKNGLKEYECTYKDGELISEKEWNEDGSIKE